MSSYLEHFRSFINAELPTYRDVFTREDMVGWIKARDNRTPRNIVEHLLKRTTNYASRDENDPPSRPAMLSLKMSNRIGWTQPGYKFIGRVDILAFINASEAIDRRQAYWKKRGTSRQNLKNH